MRNVIPRILLQITAAVAALMIASPAPGSVVQITVTNDQPAGGFALAPVWLGVQDGSFQAFSSGSTASSQITSLAQFGNTSPLSSQFDALNVGVDTTLTSGNTLKQFLPGQSNSTTLDISNPATDRFLSFAGMVVPSNDFFLGNATPLQIFNSDGSFKGPMTISIYGSNLWDSDTEAQSITTALTFIQGQTPGSGMQITNGMITTVLPGSADFLNSINGLVTVVPYTITNVPSSDQLVATIQINSVPEPASIAVFGLGVLGMIVRSRILRSRKAGKYC